MPDTAMHDPAELDALLLAAHEDGQPARLSALYSEAGNAAEKSGDRDRAAFFLTHAWVFALEAALPAAKEIEARLKEWGRA